MAQHPLQLSSQATGSPVFWSAASQLTQFRFKNIYFRMVLAAFSTHFFHFWGASTALKRHFCLSPELAMHLYRKFHSRGGVRRVYATADKNWDRQKGVIFFSMPRSRCTIFYFFLKDSQVSDVIFSFLAPIPGCLLLFVCCWLLVVVLLLVLWWYRCFDFWFSVPLTPWGPAFGPGGVLKVY